MPKNVSMPRSFAHGRERLVERLRHLDVWPASRLYRMPTPKSFERRLQRGQKLCLELPVDSAADVGLLPLPHTFV